MKKDFSFKKKRETWKPEKLYFVVFDVWLLIPISN